MLRLAGANLNSEYQSKVLRTIRKKNRMRKDRPISSDKSQPKLEGRRPSANGQVPKDKGTGAKRINEKPGKGQESKLPSASGQVPKTKSQEHKGTQGEARRQKSNKHKGQMILQRKARKQAVCVCVCVRACVCMCALNLRKNTSRWSDMYGGKLLPCLSVSEKIGKS